MLLLRSSARDVPLLLVAALIIGVLAAGCSGAGAAPPTSPASAPIAPTTMMASPSVGPVASPSPPLPAVFAGTVSRLPEDLRAAMRGTVWHPGCPVGLDDLRLLTFRYWGFDGQVHDGPMVVNVSAAKDALWVFHRLFVARFPIRHVALNHGYLPGQYNPNTRSDTTSAFDCRPAITTSGATGVFSQHSYGLAIDVNSLENPEIASNGTLANRYSRPYADRSKDLPGMIHAGDVVVSAFAHIGWGWGGTWSGMRDYMHFSATGG